MDLNLNDGGLDSDAHSQQQQTPSTASPSSTSGTSDHSDTTSSTTSPSSTSGTSDYSKTTSSTATPVANTPPTKGTADSSGTAPSTAIPVANTPPNKGTADSSGTAPSTATPVANPSSTNATSVCSYDGSYFRPRVINVASGEFHGCRQILTLTGCLIRPHSGELTGGLSASLLDTDGQIVGGRLIGPLIAAGHVEVLVGSFAIKPAVAGPAGVQKRASSSSIPEN